MPPKIKITREMIIDAGFELVRESGVESISARTVAERLNCSTQPVLYSFKTVDEIKRAVYLKADEFHTEYLMNVSDGDILLGIGLNYIRFAINEPNLFRFLFQWGYAKGNSLLEIIDAEDLKPVISAMQQAMGMSEERTKEIFLTIAMFSHGYASIIANNSLEYDEKVVESHLERAYRGAVLAVQEKTGGMDFELS